MIVFNDQIKEVRIIEQYTSNSMPSLAGLFSKVEVCLAQINNSPNYISVANKKQQEAVLQLYEHITSSIRIHILDNLPAYYILKKKKSRDPKELADIIYDSCRSDDKLFMDQFKNS